MTSGGFALPDGSGQGLDSNGCLIHIRHMLNLLAYVLGALSLLIVLPSTIPLLGWGNWFALPVIILGVIVGALSSKNGGRNFCLIVLLVAAIRLSLGGGVI